MIILVLWQPTMSSYKELKYQQNTNFPINIITYRYDYKGILFYILDNLPDDSSETGTAT